MQHQLNTFRFGSNPIRVVPGPDGEPRWVAKDVAEALGYSKASNPARLFTHIPEEWKGVNRIHTPSGDQEMVTLSEPGLFFFLNRSDKSAALPFQKWVAGEVLPSIRKTGSYTARPRHKARPRLTNPLIKTVRDQVGHANTTAWMIETFPEQFGNLPYPIPPAPQFQQVVTPTLGLIETIKLPALHPRIVFDEQVQP